MFSCEKYIQYHRQPHSTFMSMEKFNAVHSTMMYDPQIEEAIRQQHKVSDNYQEFDLKRSDLMSREERVIFFSEWQTAKKNE